MVLLQAQGRKYDVTVSPSHTVPIIGGPIRSEDARTKRRYAIPNPDPSSKEVREAFGRPCGR